MSTNQSPGESTFDIVPPRRPGLNDFNGNTKSDDIIPADPVTQPNAAEWTTLCALIVAAEKVVENAKISVHYVAGSPTIDKFGAQNNNVSGVGFFGCARTSGGAASGDVTITWPAGTFPADVVYPVAHVNGLTPGMVTCDVITPTGGNEGVRVITVNAAGAATDLSFTLFRN